MVRIEGLSPTVNNLRAGDRLGCQKLEILCQYDPKTV